MQKENWSLRPSETLIKIPGLKHDLSIIQITDSHLTEADEREIDSVRSLAEKRKRDSQEKSSLIDLSQRDIFLAQIQLCNSRQVISLIPNLFVLGAVNLLQSRDLKAGIG